MSNFFQPFDADGYGLQYIASYTDLMNAFGANIAAGEAHYWQRGRYEDRWVGS